MKGINTKSVTASLRSSLWNVMEPRKGAKAERREAEREAVNEGH